MKPPRGRPDHEAESFKVEAEEISKPKKFYRNSRHNGQRIEAKGKIKTYHSRLAPEQQGYRVRKARRENLRQAAEAPPMASYRGRVTAPASRIIGRIPDGDAENDNGASEVQFLRDGSP